MYIYLYDHLSINKLMLIGGPTMFIYIEYVIDNYIDDILCMWIINV